MISCTMTLHLVVSAPACAFQAIMKPIVVTKLVAATAIVAKDTETLFEVVEKFGYIKLIITFTASKLIKPQMKN